MSVCVGCLGSQRCWVCLGHGVIDAARGKVVPCHRCYATGRCTMCQQIHIVDIGAPPELSVEDARTQSAAEDPAGQRAPTDQPT